MAALTDKDATHRAAQQRQARANAAERRRAASARSAYEGIKEMLYAHIDAAVQSGAKIGEGAYGPVYRCNLNGESVAVKVCS